MLMSVALCIIPMTSPTSMAAAFGCRKTVEVDITCVAVNYGVPYTLLTL